MTVFVAFLRAINVGGTGMLPMKELAALCTDLGLKDVRTYIRSGNVMFKSAQSEPKIISKLEQALAQKMSKKVDVMVRTASELRSILEGNPFPNGDPAQVVVLFLAAPAPKGLLDGPTIPGPEKVIPAGREIYIHYPNGMGRSKLRLPSAVVGTARNLNTLGKLVKWQKRRAQ